MIYDGKKNPNLLRYLALNLIPGSSYGFTLRAFNFNGSGIESNIEVFKACVAPVGISSPIIYTTTRTTMSF